MRRLADAAVYLVAVLATPYSSEPDSRSAAPPCWHTHSPSAAAMNRTLAKLTDFMAPSFNQARVMDAPDRDGPVGA